MCWNQTISLNTFIFSFFAINFAYLNNIADIYYYLFFLSFSSIQLVEYFAWGNLNNKKTIRLLSQIGLFLVSMQPILLILSIKNVEYNIKASVIALYCAFWLFCLLYFPIDFSMVKASNGHLGWNWLHFPPLVVLLWIAFYFGLLLYAKEYISFVLVLILFFYIYYTYYKTTTWGSLWCWISNIIAVKLIILTFLNPSLPNCLLFEKNK